MRDFEFAPRTRIVFGAGSLARLGELAREYGMTRVLLAADPGVAAAGIVDAARAALAGLECAVFSGFSANPDSEMVERGRAFAEAARIDGIVGLGGGSSMDCAKGINFTLTNGGTMRDYWGWSKAARPMLPSIGVPTTAGTGSEAQSYALISDPETHVKMACGDPKAAFRAALLDPALTASQPREVKAAAGYDAISHAVESFVSTKATPLSAVFAREAWRLLDANFEAALAADAGIPALGAMLLGAHLAGVAIENSMLGATHACVNPLTARYGTTHGAGIAALLPHVVRWNADPRYTELAPDLAARLEHLAQAAGLGARLAALGVREEDFPALADAAAQQWTGRFNPRPFVAAGALEIYRCAY